FPADSMLRRVGAGSIGLLGGGRALLLQLAHPLVAAGVHDHSDFRRDPLGRLQHTLEMMGSIITAEDAETQAAALRRFHDVHARIKGHLPEAVGALARNTQYSGHDPHLKLWVHATFMDTAL